jgi:hypothetical protein
MDSLIGQSSVFGGRSIEPFPDRLHQFGDRKDVTDGESETHGAIGSGRDDAQQSRNWASLML